MISFETIHETNVTRCERWHPGFPNDGWSGADWSNAVAGEVGELCNDRPQVRPGLGEGHPERLGPEADAW